MVSRPLTRRLFDILQSGKSVCDTDHCGLSVRILLFGRRRCFLHALNNGRRV